MNNESTKPTQAGITALSMKPYAVVTWTMTSWALVDMVQYRRGDDDALLIESADIEELERIMHRLNAKHMKALLTDVQQERRVVLSEDTMRLLNVLGDNARKHLEKAVSELNLPADKLTHMLDYTESVVQPETIIDRVIKNVYASGVMNGEIRP